MRQHVQVAEVLMVLLALIAHARGQQRVDSRHLYERTMSIVPMTGSGSFADPVRPMYTLLPAALKAAATSRSRIAILGFTYVLSDDSMGVFQTLLAGTTAQPPAPRRVHLAAATGAGGKPKTLDALRKMYPHSNVELSKEAGWNAERFLQL